MANPLELLFSPFFKGQPITEADSGSSQFAGHTQIASGNASVTVSTTLVKSDSLIFLTPTSVLSAALVNSLGPLVANSLVDGTSFAVSFAGQSAVPVPVKLSFMIVRR